MPIDLRTHYRHRDVAEGYDRERFSSFLGKVFQWAERRCLARVVASLPPGSRVLDAPCGTGRMMNLFLSHGLTTIGADISAEMMAIARRRMAPLRGRVAFCRLDCVQMPLADRAVISTFSVRFLQHFAPEERIPILRELQRVSQRWVVFSLGLSTPWLRLRRRIKRWLGLRNGLPHPATNREIAEELRQAGLREVQRRWTFPILSEQILLVCEPVRWPPASASPPRGGSAVGSTESELVALTDSLAVHHRDLEGPHPHHGGGAAAPPPGKRPWGASPRPTRLPTPWRSSAPMPRATSPGPI